MADKQHPMPPPQDGEFHGGMQPGGGTRGITPKNQGAPAKPATPPPAPSDSGVSARLK